MHRQFNQSGLRGSPEQRGFPGNQGTASTHSCEMNTDVNDSGIPISVKKVIYCTGHGLVLLNHILKTEKTVLI